MSEGGRPAKPTSLKVLHGDGKKNPDRVDTAEPQPASGPVEPPFALSTEAQAIWDRLAPDLERTGVLTPWDCDTFAELCEALVILREKRKAADHEGERGGPNPMTDYRSAMQTVATLAGRFGLTPADRSKLSVDSDPQRAGDDLLSQPPTAG